MMRIVHTMGRQFGLDLILYQFGFGFFFSSKNVVSDAENWAKYHPQFH